MYYENKYGSLTLVLDDEIIPIEGFRGSTLPKEYTFSIDDAEKIALITDNKCIQQSCCFPDMAIWYILFHVTANTVRKSRVINLNYIGPQNVAQEIEDVRPHYQHFMYS